MECSERGGVVAGCNDHDQHDNSENTHLQQDHSEIRVDLKKNPENINKRLLFL